MQENNIMYFHFLYYLSSSLDHDYLKKLPTFYILPFLCFLSILWYLKTNKNPVMIRWPFLGLLPSLIQNLHRIHDWSVDISNTFGGTVFLTGLTFAGENNMLFTCDPRNVKYILSSNFSNFPQGSDYKETFDIVGDGLFNVDTQFWHAQRRMARITFNAKTTRDIIANTTEKVIGDSLVPLLSHVAKQSSTSIVVDLKDVFLRYTFDSSFSIIFGTNPKSLSIRFPPNEFANAMDDASEAVFYRHIVPSSWWKLCRRFTIGNNERKMERAKKTIYQHLIPYITEKKRQDMARREVRRKSDDLLEVYIGAKQGEKDEKLLSKMSSDEFIRDNGLTFLFGVRDTTGMALTWFFWLLSNNPCVEAKIIEELKLIVMSSTKTKRSENGPQRTIKRNNPWVFEANDITRMVYLHASLCESLRLYPSAPLIRKSSLNDDVLPDGTIVPAGTMIIISNYAMGRREQVWGKDCLEFKPERWIGEDGAINLETVTKLTSFGLGPRICIGKDMAFVMMKLAVSAILYNFHVEVLEGQDIQPSPAITLKMKSGLMVKLRERANM